MDISQKELFERAARTLKPDDFCFFIEYYEYLYCCGYSIITIDNGEIYIE
tara:strand:+ start:613 stop:762 length:150 start_codon:yes stop_codon:yes gene_type:complete